MSELERIERELKHELANVVQQKKALQKLLESASAKERKRRAVMVRAWRVSGIAPP